MPTYPWEPVTPPDPYPKKPGIFERLAIRFETFLDEVQGAILKMASLPARMERNIGILIAVIVGSFIAIHYMNVRAIRSLKQ